MLGMRTYWVKLTEKKCVVELEKHGMDPEGRDSDWELEGRNSECNFQSRPKIL